MKIFELRTYTLHVGKLSAAIKIYENFEDPDFRHLLRICLTKPHLLKLMNGYLSSGDILETDINFTDQTTLENFQYNEEYVYLNNLLNTNDIDFAWDESVVKCVLNNFKGHVNLSLRYLITKD